MKNYTETEIIALLTRFESRVLPKIEWTHEAHLVVAIWYVSHYSFDEALKLVRTNIIKHNESVGTENSDTDGYHETITRFWLVLAKRFLDTNHVDNIADKCNNFINSDQSSSNYLLNFYSETLLFSINARRNWIEPDRKELSKHFEE